MLNLYNVEVYSCNQVIVINCRHVPGIGLDIGITSSKNRKKRKLPASWSLHLMKSCQNVVEMLLKAVTSLLTFVAIVAILLLILSEVCVLLGPKLILSFCFVFNSVFDRCHRKLFQIH